MIWPKITTYHARTFVFQHHVQRKFKTTADFNCGMPTCVALRFMKIKVGSGNRASMARACSVVRIPLMMKQTPVDDFKQIKQLLNNGAKCKYISYVKQLSWNRCLGMLEKKQYKSSTNVCSILNPNKKTIHIVGLCFI